MKTKEQNTQNMQLWWGGGGTDFHNRLAHKTKVE